MDLGKKPNRKTDPGRRKFLKGSLIGAALAAAWALGDVSPRVFAVGPPSTNQTAGAFQVFATTGDSNAIAQLDNTPQFALGPGGASSLDVFIKRTGTTAAKFDAASGVTFTGPLLASADNSIAIGSATARISAVNAVVSNIYHAATDANPSGVLGDGVLKMGPGGAIVPDSILARVTTPAFQSQVPLQIGGTAGVAATNNQLWTASQGSSATTIYIGNASITTSSDIRLKEVLGPTPIHAVDLIDKLHVVDFRWSDPSDRAPNNKNSRGIWTGIIAQELVKVFPFLVNAPAPNCPVCLSGKPCRDHPSPWLVDWAYSAPLAFKAVQELSAKVKSLQAEVAKLKAVTAYA